ncbi:hypothetical protein D3C75_670490 [compost metagenome]
MYLLKCFIKLDLTLTVNVLLLARNFMDLKPISADSILNFASQGNALNGDSLIPVAATNIETKESWAMRPKRIRYWLSSELFASAILAL